MKPKFNKEKHPIIHKITTLQEFMQNDYSFKNVTLKNIDFTKIDINWNAVKIDHTTFLGCKLEEADLITLIAKGALIFQTNELIPYKPYRNNLYTYEELNKLENSETVDKRIYDHFSAFRNMNNVNESLWQRVHDHSIDTAIQDLLAPDMKGQSSKKVVGIMGGHSTRRDSKEYLDCAIMAQHLAANGYFITTGGGPGIMEAGNLGAYFGAYPVKELMKSIEYLAQAPHYTDEGFEDRAITIKERYPEGLESLAIPTWFYGHEPSNAFSTYIAKYFSNSIREDTLLAISLHGVVFCPGSAGTIQEIFADAAQNHYETYDWISPMIFYGTDYYEDQLPVKDLILALSQNKKYQSKIKFTDSNTEILDFVQSNPPFKAE